VPTNGPRTPHALPPQDNYACLGITCAHVGGLWSKDLGVYFPDGVPCSDPPAPATALSLPGGLVVGIIIAAVILLALIILITLYVVVRRKRTVRRQPVCKPLPSNMEKMCVEQAI
jgi:hypothetical protein